jgi:hypothetical protein
MRVRHRSALGAEKLALTAIGFAGALALHASPARACGVSASGVASCSLAEHVAEREPHWALGVSGLYTSTSVRFSGGNRADETRAATLASVALLPSPALVLQASLGSELGGSLSMPSGKYDFSPGLLAALGADYRLLDDGRWFALLTSTLSFSAARTHADAGPSAAYEALDLRLGAEFGIDIASVLRPYALARVFGGPIFWRLDGAAVTGTDTHHYQLGAGVGLHLSRSFNAFAEGVPLGERALALGIGAAF